MYSFVFPAANLTIIQSNSAYYPNYGYEGYQQFSCIQESLPTFMTIAFQPLSFQDFSANQLNLEE